MTPKRCTIFSFSKRAIRRYLRQITLKQESLSTERRIPRFQTASKLDIEVAPVTPAQAKIARQAYRDFGRGSGHPAKLNFGDCFAYALAIDRNEPLLFKGEDFTHTGVRIA
jgi:uncharacterized protein with PIN domain